MKLTEKELLQVTGGATLSATMINAIVKGVDIVLDINRARLSRNGNSSSWRSEDMSILRKISTGLLFIIMFLFLFYVGVQVGNYFYEMFFS